VDDVGTAEVAPGEDDHGAGDHAGDGAGGVEALPVQRRQDQRAEGGAEAGPREADQAQDGVGGVDRQGAADDGDRDDGGAREVDQDVLVRQLLGHDLVQVLDERGGDHQQLGGHGGHDRGEDRG